MISTSTWRGRLSRTVKHSKSLTKDSPKKYSIWSQRLPTMTKSPTMNSKNSLSCKSRKKILPLWTKKSSRRRNRPSKRSYSKKGRKGLIISTTSSERPWSSAFLTIKPIETSWPHCLDGTQLETLLDSSLLTNISKRWSQSKTRSTSSAEKTSRFYRNHLLWLDWSEKVTKYCCVMTPLTSTSSTFWGNTKAR